MRIVFYLGPSFERWNPATAKANGICGAEKFAILITAALAKRGHDVTVFADCDEPGTFDGVHWRPYGGYTASEINVERCDVFVSWRRPEVVPPTAKTCVFVAQDNHHGNALTEEIAARYDAFFVVSPWHADLWRKLYPFTADRLFVTRNAIDVSVTASPGLARMNRAIWSSSPDRGLDHVLAVWPDVHAKTGAQLILPLRMQTVKDRAVNHKNAALAARLERIEGMLATTPGVSVLPRLGAQDMADAYASSRVWIGPTDWDEAFCMAAAEAQFYGCRIVAPKRAALATTILGSSWKLWTACHPHEERFLETLHLIGALTMLAPEHTETDREAARAAFNADDLAEEWGAKFMALAHPQLVAPVRELEPKTDPAPARKRPTIGLCMIVKDESKVIGRCLKSLAPLLDYWTVVDTGSTDDTKAQVQECFAGVPGDLYERPWTNWHVNMTEAFDLAKNKTDYVWIIDSDEEVIGALPDDADLTADAYDVEQDYAGGLRFKRTRVLATRLPWKQVGLGELQIHEYPDPGCPYTRGTLPGVVVKNHNDGRQGAMTPEQRKARYRREAESLERLVKAEPDNARAWYYLGQSWRDAGELLPALLAYTRRKNMRGTWEAERYSAAVEAAKCATGLGADRLVEYWLDAIALQPWRAEASLGLAAYYNRHDEHRKALVWARMAWACDFPTDEAGFVDPDAYTWRAADEVGIAAYWVAAKMAPGPDRDRVARISRAACEQALDSCPDAHKKRIVENLEHAHRLGVV